MIPLRPELAEFMDAESLGRYGSVLTVTIAGHLSWDAAHDVNNPRGRIGYVTMENTTQLAEMLQPGADSLRLMVDSKEVDISFADDGGRDLVSNQKELDEANDVALDNTIENRTCQLIVQVP